MYSSKSCQQLRQSGAFVLLLYKENQYNII